MPGWTFNVQMAELGPELPWDYESRARQLLATARSVLDMGTGGGERFSEICQEYAGLAVATEEWPPNVPVATARLAPMGIVVVHASSVRLPFPDGAFGLVLNRHEELDPAEVARVLAPGGRVLTQQVGRDNWRELNQFFPRKTRWGPQFELYQDGFRNSGLTIVRAETHDNHEAFSNLGAVVYMLTITPWTVPDFDVERDIDALLALEKSNGRKEGIVLTKSRYIIEAHKSAA